MGSDLALLVRHALRRLARSPGFTAVVVLTLALGIGAATAVWSVVDGVLLKPLPYGEPGRLVALFSQFKGRGFDHFWISPPEYVELSSRLRTLSLGAYVLSDVNVVGRDEPQRVRAAFVTASLLEVLGRPPVRGGYFTAQQDVPGGPAVVLLSEGLFRRSFGGDPGLVGRSVRIDGEPNTVVGVLPAGYLVGGEKVDAVLPLRVGSPDATQRVIHFLSVVGRLAPGATLEGARAELAGFVARWEKELPELHTPNPDQHPVVIEPLLADTTREVRRPLSLLAAAVVALLLIACLNVANLLLARGQSQQRELAVQAALGAGRGRLSLQLFVETVLLALAGAAGGALLARWVVGLLPVLLPGDLLRADQVRVDLRALLFAFAAAALAALLVGLFPAWMSSGGAQAASLREGSLRGTGDRRGRFLRQALVVAEVALAAALLWCGGLLFTSFRALSRVEPGLRTEGVLAFELSLPEPSYPEPARTVAFFSDLQERLAELPRVTGVAMLSDLPPKRSVQGNDAQLESVPPVPDGPPQNADFWQFTTPGSLEALGIPLLEGRGFTPSDAAGRPGVVLINQKMAKTHWPARSSVGDRLRIPLPGLPWLTIVGVVGNVHQAGLDREPGTEIFFPLAQAQESTSILPRTMSFLAISEGDPLALSEGVRRAVRQRDPALALAGMEPFSEVVRRSIGHSRFLTVLVLIFGGAALLLAAVGTYGVMAYSVERRRREIGVRMALGARVGTVIGQVLAEGARLTGLGLALGLAAAFLSGRLIESLLYGVAPHDLRAFLGGAAVLAAAAALACYLPARRAARVDPGIALRPE